MYLFDFEVISERIADLLNEGIEIAGSEELFECQEVFPPEEADAFRIKWKEFGELKKFVLWITDKISGMESYQ